MRVYRIIIQYALIILVSWFLFMVMLYLGLEIIDWILTISRGWLK